MLHVLFMQVRTGNMCVKFHVIIPSSCSESGKQLLGLLFCHTVYISDKTKPRHYLTIKSQVQSHNFVLVIAVKNLTAVLLKLMSYATNNLNVLCAGFCNSIAENF